ncbi:TPA: hypothetical protein N0F65_000228 [Lagenidium giganteum]|uniref:Uncharacterized protein n=1 Tax=Lagenidium giganteum TaxID=4803 RepID=A0AAV2YI87_9STRA|nr:TPA: hypothetical protein N0F65_000228 [Lagenidium giganteum]
MCVKREYLCRPRAPTRATSMSSEQWLASARENPEQYFDEDGELNVHVFRPSDFEEFLLAKVNDSTQMIKASTLTGFRSAVKDVY